VDAAHVSSMFIAVLDAYATIEDDEVDNVSRNNGTMHGFLGRRSNEPVADDVMVRINDMNEVSRASCFSDEQLGATYSRCAQLNFHT
jgi:hypothetical protein